ncbi:hypothetical protein HNQ50_001587 [Silvimonas terrae]|uniref:DUF4239 domain-containing protein n=1 Tax=Silvimonas terrae TaxID=300266 RepID=A0A840RE47_9NEIS|nr:hypothetical protein [Silvimonas terrae]MBB5190864.1 hypothetical protein [Silvimonas terrae]
MAQLIDRPLIFFVVALVFMFLAALLGARFTHKERLQDDEVRADFGTVQSAALTLLALVIGFSLSMAVGRYDQRKNYEEEEANAIGTEYLRADLLAPAQAQQMRTLLKQYLEQRILYYSPLDEAALAAHNKQTAILQNSIWMAARDGTQSGPNPVTALAVAGANDVINTQGYTQAAWWNRIPAEAWALMIVLGLFCNFLVGYGAHGAKTSTRLLAIMPLTIAISLMLIADIDSPRKGLIRVVPQNLLSLASSMGK